MKQIHFDEKPKHLSEEEFKEGIIAAMLERLRAADRIVRAAEYYYHTGEFGPDFATEKTGERKLCIFFRICVAYEDEDGSEAKFHKPVTDMVRELIEEVV